MLIHTEQKHAGLLCHTCLVFGSISARHLDNSCFIFPSGKKKQNHKRNTVLSLTNRWAMRNGSSMPIVVLQLRMWKGLQKRKLVYFCQWEIRLPLQKGWSRARSRLGTGCSFQRPALTPGLGKFSLSLHSLGTPIPTVFIRQPCGTEKQ